MSLILQNIIAFFTVYAYGIPEGNVRSHLALHESVLPVRGVIVMFSTCVEMADRNITESIFLL